MKLTYRDVQYSNRSADKTTTVIEQEHATIYRGVPYRLTSSTRRIQEPQRLVYRGVPYMTGCASLPF